MKKDTGDNIETLAIVGNGFDLMHGAQSQYSKFRDFLDRRSDLRWSLENYLDCDDLWGDFEGALAYLDHSAMLGDIDNCLQEFGAYKHALFDSEFVLGLKRAIMPAQIICEDLPVEFKRWINTLSVDGKKRISQESMQRFDAFINFNYTNFLETLYGIPKEKILYLHGCRQDDSRELIIGHKPCDMVEDGVKKTVFPGYYGGKKLEMVNIAWQEAIEYLQEYEVILEKNTQKVIENNADFWSRLSGLKCIVVVGHSLSEVDYPYFEKIIKSCVEADKITWCISWFNDNDLMRIETFRKNMGINEGQIKLYESNKMDEILNELV